ncbi:MAG: fibronectin type III domain-containing protein [Bacteroidales bacterium]|jgi:hypothetical protein|nr:fibronectin type III domain-containing protein [Bacteroidales bacterium]
MKKYLLQVIIALFLCGAGHLAAQTLIEKGATWFYSSEGSMPSDWPQSTGAEWATGQAPLGYAEHGNSTWVGGKSYIDTVNGSQQDTVVTLIPNGYNNGCQYTTAYFVKAFNIDNYNAKTSFKIWAAIDDAGVFYVNGIEVHRQQFSTDYVVTYNSTGGGYADDPFTVNVPGELLHEGMNYIQVEIHQSDGFVAEEKNCSTSSDLFFDMSLSYANAADAPAIGNPVLTIGSVTESTIPVSWEKATDNTTPASELQYRVEWKKQSASGWSYSNYQVDIAEYTITGLLANTTYDIRVVATNTAGHFSYYTSNSATTLPDTIAPVVENLTITAIGYSASSIELSWYMASDNATEQQNLLYLLEWKQTTATNWENEGYQKAINAYTIEGLLLDTEYDIRLHVKDESGNRTDYTPTKARTSKTGIDNIDPRNLENLQIYPNPTRDELTLDRIVKSLEIIDLTGKIMLDAQMPIGNTINVSALPAGIYLLRAYTSEGTITKKFVKE